MKAINETRISFLSRSANEGFARSAVAAFVSQLDPAVDQLSDLRVALSEAVTNCIVHAYPDSIGMITVTVRLYEDGKVVIKVRDRGLGIPDVAKAMEPMYTTGDEDRSGLGFLVMETFVDKLRVRSKVGSGTTVTLEKYIHLRSADKPV